MEGPIVLDTENNNVAGKKTKGEKMVRGSAVGNAPRRTLTDITNLPRQNEAANRLSISLNTKEYIDKLQQENLALVKLVAERNKFIELTATELHRLRVDYQKVQQQNLQLAQANSQMLAELNSSKDKLKALHHELGCKNGLLMARKLEAEGIAKTVKSQIRGNVVETIKCDEAGEFSQTEAEKKPCNTKRKRLSKIQASDDTTTNTVQVKSVDKQRVNSRRQSARFNSEAQESTEDVFEIADIKLKPVEHDPIAVKPVQAQEKTEEKRFHSRRQSARFKPREEEPITDLSKIDNALASTTLKPVLDENNVDNESKLCSRRRSTRFQSLEAQKSTECLSQIDDAKVSVSFPHDDPLHDGCQTSSVSSMKNESDNLDNKRLCSLRRPTRLQSVEAQKSAESLSQADDAKVSVSPNKDSCQTLSVASVKNESKAENNTPGLETQELGKLSTRPVRRAVERVQSYKEIPLNVKMRRTT